MMSLSNILWDFFHFLNTRLVECFPNERDLSRLFYPELENFAHKEVEERKTGVSKLSFETPVNSIDIEVKSQSLKLWR